MTAVWRSPLRGPYPEALTLCLSSTWSFYLLGGRNIALDAELAVDGEERDRQYGPVTAVQNHSEPGPMNVSPSVLMSFTLCTLQPAITMTQMECASRHPRKS